MSQEEYAHQENLINELKGHLFEFFLGHALSQELNCEEQYLFQIHHNPHIKKNLTIYERELGRIEKNMPFLIQQLAQSSVKIIQEKLLKENIQKISGIEFCGKWIKNDAHSEVKDLKNIKEEADLVLYTSSSSSSSLQDFFIPLSLKLGKKGSFVNTKNGGVQSFLVKYFDFFSPEKNQLELNEFLKISNLKMTFQLEKSMGLELWDKKTQKEQLEVEGYSLLPGQLPQDMRTILFDYYHEVARRIYLNLCDYYEKNPAEFTWALLKLCGLTLEGMWQLVCYHHQHHLHRIRLLTERDISELLNEGIRMEPIKKGLSSFQIFIGKKENLALQIRVKPMNEYLSTSLKVNCSLKEK
jgi:hypothetical protein